MTPGDVMLWALAAFVVVVLATMAAAMIIGTVRRAQGHREPRARVTRIDRG